MARIETKQRLGIVTTPWKAPFQSHITAPTSSYLLSYQPHHPHLTWTTFLAGRGKYCSEVAKERSYIEKGWSDGNPWHSLLPVKLVHQSPTFRTRKPASSCHFTTPKSQQQKEGVVVLGSCTKFFAIIPLHRHWVRSMQSWGSPA